MRMRGVCQPPHPSPCEAADARLRGRPRADGSGWVWSASMRLLLPFLLLASLSGCANVCDRKCEAETDLIERCLDDWGTTWAELGYANRDESLDRCFAVWGDGFQETDRGSDERQALSDECTADLQAAEADTDCQTLLD